MAAVAADLAAVLAAAIMAAALEGADPAACTLGIILTTTIILTTIIVITVVGATDPCLAAPVAWAAFWV